MRAVDQFGEHLGQLSFAETRTVDSDLEAFGEIFSQFAPSASRRNSREPSRSRRLLIVENEVNVAGMLADILFDYQTVVAVTLQEAMQIVTEQLGKLDGALIDLHLTERLDSAGLEVLSYIRDQRPDLPRLLITASPPPVPRSR